MLKEALEYILQLQRPVDLIVDNKEYIYSDEAKQYGMVHKPLHRNICNVESFAQVVLETARRLENTTGHQMTVVFDREGAEFFSNDAASGHMDRWAFKRQLSQQWKHLNGHIDAKLTHLELLRIIQGLRPSINHSLVDFKTLFTQFRSVSFSGNTIATSQPILEGGKTNASLSFNLQANSNTGDTHVSLPGVIPLVMQFARNSDKLYGFEIELDGALTEDKKIAFKLIFPEREIVIEQAIKDEVEYFREQTKVLPQLLTVLSY